MVPPGFEPATDRSRNQNVNHSATAPCGGRCLQFNVTRLTKKQFLFSHTNLELQKSIQDEGCCKHLVSNLKSRVLGLRKITYKIKNSYLLRFQKVYFYVKSFANHLQSPCCAFCMIFWFRIHSQFWSILVPQHWQETFDMCHFLHCSTTLKGILKCVAFFTGYYNSQSWSTGLCTCHRKSVG